MKKSNLNFKNRLITVKTGQDVNVYEKKNKKNGVVSIMVFVVLYPHVASSFLLTNN